MHFTSFFHPPRPRGRRVALVSLIAQLACADVAPIDTSLNRVDPALLAPTLLDDRDEMAIYLEAFPVERYESVEVPDLGRFYLDDNPALVKQTLRAGRVWEEDLQDVMEDHARRDSVVLDVGAHIGSHTLALARWVGPDGAVYAFEPQRKIYRELVKNVELNGLENVVPLRFAVGAYNGVVEMMAVGDRDGLARVGKGGESAELRTIDSFGFKNVSLIKIDVEEYEGPVLLGAVQTIRAWRPAIVVEILGTDIYDRLSPAQRASIDRTRRLLEELDYELDLISCDGGCDFLALHRG
jgi:FkbM family methyltransferase